ncbi:protein BIG GRAIN 1-like E [Tasmannia lanceolata]|uniref:protein BIG GRAIN 1-like E n=1 Tax=Tasmannia lanceolata TaxID=3420 RepID=UPI0040645A75
MSTMGITHYEHSKKPSHRRNDSGELDVFEASRYFSGIAEAAGGFSSGTVCHKSMKEEGPMWVGARKSVDMSMRSSLRSQSHRLEKHIKEKKSKKPSSPGGRLASFLNSLFSQTNSKKKSKSSTQSMKDEEESPSGRRKRRSSISHFRGIGGADQDAKSIHSSISGFRTPPPYSNNPMKVSVNSNSDQKPIMSLSKCNEQPTSVTLYPQNAVFDEKKQMNFAWLDEKLKFKDGFLDKNNFFSNGFLEKDGRYNNEFMEKKWVLQKDRKWVNEFSSEEKSIKRDEELDDGGESDSSSDLFELQNYDLSVYSNGLPVYESTHMESIKRASPIVHGIY